MKRRDSPDGRSPQCIADALNKVYELQSDIIESERNLAMLKERKAQLLNQVSIFVPYLYA